MKTLSRYAALAAVIGCLSALGHGSALAETLSLQGSSGFVNEVLTLYQARIEALTGHKLNVTANKSDRGLLALFNGEADLAMVSAPLEYMVALMRETRPNLPFHLLREFRVAQARVAYPVNPGNPVRSVSIAKLKQILTGQITNWRELGGRDLPIRVVSMRDGGGTKRTTEAILFEGEHIKPRSEILVDTAEDVMKVVAQERGALGITQARLVSLHGLPEIQTKVSIQRPHSLVSLNDPTEAMRSVIVATRSVLFDEEP